MKKTITLAALALGLAVSASAATLQYGLNFDKMGSSGGLVFENLGVGKTTIERTSGYVNYGSNAIGATSGYSHMMHGATFKIEDAAGINGLDFENGFSLGIHLNYNNTNAWKNGLSIKIDDATLTLQFSGSDWFMYGAYALNIEGTAAAIPDDPTTEDDEARDEVPLTLMSNVTKNTWRHLGLTFQGDEMQVYVDGELFKTITGLNTTTDSTLKYVGAPVDRRVSDVYIDNLALYSGVLSADDMKYLSTHNIPEPATATLSLLALAGLAARRRRK